MAIKINADNSTGLEITSDTSTNIDLQSNDVTKMSIGSTIDIQGNELVLDADADTSIHASTDDQIDFKTGGTDRMAITTDITAPSEVNVKLHGSGSAGTQAGLWIRDLPRVTNDTSTFEHTYLNSNNSLIFTKGSSATTSSNTERMRIETNGRLCLGTSDPASGGSSGDHLMTIDTNSTYQNAIVYVLHGNNNPATFFTSDSTYAGAIACSGSSTTYNTSSDYRLKENVNYSFDATNVIKSLKPCKFNFIGESETKTGFLAHEVSPYIEQAVHGTKDATKTYTDKDGKEQTVGDYQGIDLSQLVPTLVKTIQELEARITALES